MAKIYNPKTGQFEEDENEWYSKLKAEHEARQKKKEQDIKQLGILEIKNLQNGQLRPYGDSDYIWIIKTDRTAVHSSILNFCQEHLRKNSQTYTEWMQARCDLDVFFRGYHFLKDNGDGSYKYKVHEPCTE